MILPPMGHLQQPDKPGLPAESVRQNLVDIDDAVALSEHAADQQQHFSVAALGPEQGQMCHS